MMSSSVSVVLCAFIISICQAQSLPGNWRWGQATYHTFSGTTACGIPNSDTLVAATSSFPYGYISAMSTDTFNSGTGCGGCFEIKCLGPWVATNVDCSCNSAVDSIVIQAVDLSGDFSPPHFDISTAGWNAFTDTCGRINITFRETACKFTQNIQIVTEANHAWWFGMRVQKVAGYGQLCAVSIRSYGASDTQWMSCTNTGSKWSCDDSSLEPTTLPITVKLQTCDGAELIGTDVITSFDSGTYDFGANFPFSSSGATTTTTTTSTTTTASDTTTTTSTTTTTTATTTTTTTTASGNSGVSGVVSIGMTISSGCGCGSSCSSTSSPVCWYFGLSLSVPSGVTINDVNVRNRGSSEWVDAEWGSSTAWGFGNGVAYTTPVVVQVQTSSGTVYGVFTSLSGGATAAANAASPYEEDEDVDEEEKGIHWTVWFAVVVSVLLFIAVIVAGIICCKRNKNKGTATFEDEEEQVEEIEVETQMVNAEEITTR